ncbi:MAG: polysaccharide deacetylase family protein [Fibrobacteraceae bacterium]|nr:polysaccharide deacetylase family protein [Fibrobacteraceae bacterium]
MGKKIFHSAVISSAIIALASSMSFAQTAEIADWAGFRKAATSFTFDDGAPSHVSDGAPTFDKYGYKATFHLVTNWNPNWSGFQTLANNGHEIASHSSSHPTTMNGEEASSKQAIERQITQNYGSLTVAYPNCNVPNESSVLQNYIAGRICNGSWQGLSDNMGKNGPSNWAKVPAIMTGDQGSINSTNGFTSEMQKVIQSGGWVMFLTHGFSGKNNGSATYSPTDLNAIDGALQWAKQNDKDIWVAPFRNVAMYIKERNASKIEPQDGGEAGTMSFKLSHNIADNVSKYDYPLSIRIQTNWTNVKVSQNNADIESKVENGYVYFDAVPNAGTIVVKNADAATEPPVDTPPTCDALTLDCYSAEELCSMGVAEHCANPIAQFPNNAPLAVYKSSDNYIVVSGAQGKAITVFNNLGQIVRTTRDLGFEQKVYAGAKGAYIVKVGNKTFNIRL